MIVAADIVGRHGETLLSADTPLDDAQVDSLRRRGIKCIAIKVADDRDAAAIAHDIAAAEARLAHIFRGAGSETRAELQRAIGIFRRTQAS